MIWFKKNEKETKVSAEEMAQRRYLESQKAIQAENPLLKELLDRERRINGHYGYEGNIAQGYAYWGNNPYKMPGLEHMTKYKPRINKTNKLSVPCYITHDSTQKLKEGYLAHIKERDGITDYASVCKIYNHRTIQDSPHLNETQTEYIAVRLVSNTSFEEHMRKVWDLARKKGGNKLPRKENAPPKDPMSYLEEEPDKDAVAQDDYTYESLDEVMALIAKSEIPTL